MLLFSLAGRGSVDIKGNIIAPLSDGNIRLTEIMDGKSTSIELNLLLKLTVKKKIWFSIPIF